MGETLEKTNKVISKALGGLLFIDEAYSLVQKGYSEGDAYGKDVVDTLLARIENERTTDNQADKLAIVIAGYPEDIDRFLDTNEGLASRFTTRIEFDSYTPDELIKIADLVAADLDALYGGPAQEFLLQSLAKMAGNTVEVEDYDTQKREVPALDKAGNGRFARTVTEKAVEYRDLRLTAGRCGGRTQQ